MLLQEKKNSLWLFEEILDPEVYQIVYKYEDMSARKTSIWDHMHAYMHVLVSLDIQIMRCLWSINKLSGDFVLEIMFRDYSWKG